MTNASPGTRGKPRRIDFHADEFLVGTSDLTLEETGAYWKVCSLIYSRGEPIRNDDRWIARVLGVDVRTWRPIKARLVAKGKLILAGGSITNARCEVEVAKACRRIETARENGTLGGRPRSAPSTDRPEISRRSPPKSAGDLHLVQPTIGPDVSVDRSRISPPALFENCDLGKSEGFCARKINQELRTKNREPRTKKREDLYVDQIDSPDFEKWWALYPHKVGKGAARKAFRAALTKTTFEALADGVERYKQKKPPTQEWCHPATWLNEERWTDQPAPVRPAKSYHRVPVI